MLIKLCCTLKLFSQLQSQMQKNKSQKKKRQPWTEAEDQALLKTKSQNQLQTWNKISHILQSDFGFIRNEKQCRDRHELHLKQNGNSAEWNEQDQTTLFKKFEEISGKWSIIAASFEGRTGSFLKNQFYSKLRKGIRRINNTLPIIFQKTIMNIPIDSIYQLVKKINSNFPCQNFSKGQIKVNSENLARQFRILSSLKKIANIDESQLFTQDRIRDIRDLYKQISQFLGGSSCFEGIQQDKAQKQFILKAKNRQRISSLNKDDYLINNNFSKDKKGQSQKIIFKSKKQDKQEVRNKIQKVKKIKKDNQNKKINKKHQQNKVNTEMNTKTAKKQDEELLSEYSEIRADLFFQSQQFESAYMAKNEYENNRRVESFPELDQELIFESDQQSSS